MKLNQLTAAGKAGGQLATTSSIIPLIDQWLNELRTDPATRQKYRAALKYFNSYLLERGIDIVSFTEPQLNDYCTFLEKDSKKKESTAKYYFGLVLRFIGWLSKRGYIERNIAAGIKGIRANNDTHKRDALTADEAAKLIASFKVDIAEGDAEWKIRRKAELTLRNKAIATLMVCCGLRCIEICRLDIKDRCRSRHGQWMLRVHGKMRNGKGDLVVLPEKANKILKAYLAVRGDVEGDAPMFVSTSRQNKGKRFTPQVVSKMIKAQLIKIIDDPDDSDRINHVVAHSLRHTNATIAFEQGVSIDDVSLNLRHKSTATTLVYLHTEQVFKNTANNAVTGAVFDKLKGLTDDDGY